MPFDAGADIWDIDDVSLEQFEARQALIDSVAAENDAAFDALFDADTGYMAEAA